MELAKPQLDVAVFTERLEPMLHFWQQEAGLAFEELLPTGGGNHQHRHGVHGSVFKLNHPRDGLPAAPPSGYRELWIAQEGRVTPGILQDPDGNAVRLVPPGHEGVAGVGVGVAVRDLGAHACFYAGALGLERLGEARFRCGDSLLFLREDPGATAEVSIRGPGFRYLTIQVFDCAKEHAAVLARGGREGAAPRRHGDVAIFSMVRDPDGNWIELSQRASLTGSLD